MPTVYEAELGKLEEWVLKNSCWLALGITGVAFALRLAYSDYCYLNPDEAIHFGAARPTSWLETYEASRRVAHPPLFILVLHGILTLGRTELILRLPSVVSGTLALWIAFAWMRRSFGELPALAALSFLALSPAAISASTEVRQYGLLLCFVCCSLYATERIFSERSTLWALAQGFFLLASLLTHYITIVVILSLDVYILLRLIFDRVPRRILYTIAASHVALAVVLGWLYFTHIRLPGGPLSSTGMEYLQHSYYSKQIESPLGFLWRMVFWTFVRVIGSRKFAFLPMLAFLAGLVAIGKGRTKAPRLMVILLLSPFAVGLAAATFRVFPFVGSRHQAYLLPFVAAGISASLAWVNGRLATLLLLVGSITIAPLWVVLTKPDNDRRTQSRGDMTRAIEYIHRVVPQGASLFADYETRLTLEYYLARDDNSLDRLVPGGVEESLGGYHVIVPGDYEWVFRADKVLEQVNELSHAQGVAPGTPLWIVSAAWAETSLAARLPARADLDVMEFGRISVIKTTARRGSGVIGAAVSENSLGKARCLVRFR